MQVKYLTKDYFSEAAEQIASYVTEKLESTNLILLLSGGSTAKTYNYLAQLLIDSKLENLTIGLVDERYFPHGSEPKNFNSILIKETDLYKKLAPKIKEFKLINYEALDMTMVVEDYNNFIERSFLINSERVALLGIGTDGHTAGILPIFSNQEFQSKFESAELFTSYIAPDFPYRLSLTYTTLKKLTKVFVCLTGAEKKDQYLKLLATENNFDLNTSYNYPAGILSVLPTELLTDLS